MVHPGGGIHVPIDSRPKPVPGLVCGLILLAMAPTMSRAWEHTTVAGAGGVPLIEGYRAMARGLSAHPLPNELEDIAFLTGLMQPSYVRRAMTKLPLRDEDLAGKINVPVLISVGSNDREWPLERCRAAVALLPHARLSVYEGFGHFPSSEAAERFNRELEGLVREINLQLHGFRLSSTTLIRSPNALPR